MADREKVIKGLEACLAAEVTEDENPCASCPYFVDELCQSAIKKDVLALLKEQEPVKPVDYDAWGGKKCEECGTIFDVCVREDTTVRIGTDYGYVHNRVRYCPWCGRKVKWDD